MEKHDVIIIGGGPSGATLAHYLKEKGIESLIIEKGKPFRDKVCAGGLPPRIFDILPSNLQNFEKVAYDKFSVDYKGIYNISASVGKPFVYGVMRTSFDQFLRNDTNTQYEEKFINYKEENSSIIVNTDKSKYSCKFLVGADGVGSYISIQSGLCKNKRFINAEEKEVKVEVSEKSRLDVFLGYNTLGYGWTLPKNGYASSGSGTIKGKFLRGTVNKFDKGDALIKVFPIAIWDKPEPLTKGKIALVGEAGNLVDPFNAAGIFPSILSSMLLSETLKKKLDSGGTDLNEYNELLADKLYDEFKLAYALSNIFYPFLPILHRTILKERFLNVLLESASRGYISYKEIYKKVENSKKFNLKVAYNLIKLLRK